MKKQATNENDFTRFLFRATGQNKGGEVTDLDLADNLRAELDRLHAMAELLENAVGNPVPPGTPELLRDIWERSSWLLDLWDKGRKRKQ